MSSIRNENKILFYSEVSQSGQLPSLFWPTKLILISLIDHKLLSYSTYNLLVSSSYSLSSSSRLDREQLVHQTLVDREALENRKIGSNKTHKKRKTVTQHSLPACWKKKTKKIINLHKNCINKAQKLLIP